MIDKELLLSNAQVVTTSAPSESYIDQAAGNAVRHPLTLVARVAVAFATGTSIVVSLQTDSDVAFGSPTTVLASGVILTAACKVNTVIFEAPVPPTLERYVRGYFTIDGTYDTGSAIDLYLVDSESKLAAIS